MPNEVPSWLKYILIALLSAGGTNVGQYFGVTSPTQKENTLYDQNVKLMANHIVLLKKNLDESDKEADFWMEKFYAVYTVCLKDKQSDKNPLDMYKENDEKKEAL